MPDMKGLGDVDGGIVDADHPARADVGGTVFFPFAGDAREHVPGESRLVHLEIEIAVEGGNFRDHAVGRNGSRQLLRNGDGALSENFGEPEAGKRIVPHRGIGRNGQKRSDLFRAHALRFDFFCNVLSVIHKPTCIFFALFYHKFLQLANERFA